MKIKLAILETDQNYMMRIVSAFSTKYADQFEIYSFTSQEAALQVLGPARVDVLIASDAFDIDVSQLPKRCGFAYFVETAGVATVKEQKAICKFQKADLIYKQILSIYSEKAGSIFGTTGGEDKAQVLLFTSPSGGCGASSMAAACAARYAKRGKKVLYLNCEKFGTADTFFSGEGQFDMSDIIYALKSRKANLFIKLESCVRQDARGVCFFASPKVALDMLELSSEDIVQVITELRSKGSYDYLILDMDFSLDKKTMMVWSQAQVVCWVGDGSEISNEKLRRAHKALSILEQNEDASLTGRLAILYNKFSGKTSKVLEDLGIKEVGGAPRLEHAATAQIVERLSEMEMLDRLL